MVLNFGPVGAFRTGPAVLNKALPDPSWHRGAGHIAARRHWRVGAGAAATRLGPGLLLEDLIDLPAFTFQPFESQIEDMNDLGGIFRIARAAETKIAR